MAEYQWRSSDDWFADFLRRVQNGSKKGRALKEAIPRHRDKALTDERRYDAESAYLLKRIHNGNRRPVPGVTAPAHEALGSAS